MENEQVEPTPANNQGKPMDPLQPEVVKKLLDNLPGIIGGIDYATRDNCGQHVPFVLLYFTGNAALHATNIGSREAAMLTVGYAKAVCDSDPELAAIFKGE
jgi:hypothetical protein